MIARKRPGRSTQRRRVALLPIQALYPACHLARVMGVSHRKLQRLLKDEGVQVFYIGRFLLVPLTELEEKVPVLWASVTAAESLRTALADA